MRLTLAEGEIYKSCQLQDFCSLKSLKKIRGIFELMRDNISIWSPISTKVICVNKTPKCVQPPFPLSRGRDSGPQTSGIAGRSAVLGNTFQVHALAPLNTNGAVFQRCQKDALRPGVTSLVLRRSSNASKCLKIVTSCFWLKIKSDNFRPSRGILRARVTAASLPST